MPSSEGQLFSQIFHRSFQATSLTEPRMQAYPIPFAIKGPKAQFFLFLGALITLLAALTTSSPVPNRYLVGYQQEGSDHFHCRTENSGRTANSFICHAGDNNHNPPGRQNHVRKKKILRSIEGRARITRIMTPSKTANRGNRSLSSDVHRELLRSGGPSRS